MYKFELDGMWILIFILCSCVCIYILAILTILFFSFLETRFNIVCICRGWRFDSNPNIIIPLYCYCRRNNNNTQILPITKMPKIINLKEYNKKTGNIIIINPKKDLSIGNPKN